MSARTPIVASKIEPPAALAFPSVRRAPIDQWAGGTTHLAIIGPPGYGKTVLAREAHAACRPGTAAWLSVDLLDRQPVAFWTHLVTAMRSTTAVIDDEPLELLAERTWPDYTFLAALCEQIRASPDPIVLVLDDVDRIDDPDVTAGLDRLAEWTNGHLRLVLTGRVDPALPLAKWRTRGMLADLREDDLRFDRSASRRFATAFAPGVLSDADVDALHDRVEGWPVALQVALILARDADDPHAEARKMAGTNRLFADYVTGEILDRLSEDERSVALGLSILERFDLELCRDLLGAASVPALRSLLDRRLLIVGLAGGRWFRFHSLIRELLESELRWRDPERHRDLHHRVGELFADGGHLIEAARHLLAANDPDRASEVVARPAMELVDAGRIDELVGILAQLPVDLQVSRPEQAIELAFAELITGRRNALERRLRQAAALTPADDARLRAHLLVVLTAERMLVGDADATVEHIAELDRLRAEVPSDSPLWSRLDGVLARCAQFLAFDDAEERILAMERSATPRPILDVVEAATMSLVAFDRGNLIDAERLAAFAEARSTTIETERHPAMFETTLAAGWTAWARGEFDRARELADRAFDHPAAAFPMWWVRVAALASDCLTRAGGAAAAIDLVDQLDPDDLRFDLVRSHARRLTARALLAARRPGEVCDLLAPEQRSPDRDLLLARAELDLGRRDAARDLVDRIDDWPTP
ncbi:MAG: AAA family ATPase, partial [Chloroflexota bacterium]|nr:AAA family ATPase [Chloroflexota bacterium]